MGTGIIFKDECNRNKDAAVGKTAQRIGNCAILVNEFKAKMIGASAFQKYIWIQSIGF